VYFLEFRELWDNLNLPPEADILKSLAQDGLQATMTEALPVRQLPSKKKGKKARATTRQTKITNTHLPGIDLSKDYVKPS
jgi:transcription initiation factor TFIIE subunit beta